MTFYQSMPWHHGEEMMHQKMRVPDHDNPTVPQLSAQAASMLQRAPLIAVGTLDEDSRPWTTLWGGENGLSQPIGQNIIGIRTPVAARLDPVVEALVGSKPGPVVRAEGKGKMVGGLAIDLQTRKRVKLYGRMMAGALSIGDDEDDESSGKGAVDQGEIQLVIKVEQTLGNCPKYLNKKQLSPAPTLPELLSDSPVLTQRGIDIVTNADLFFISTSHSVSDMDTNHRGGPRNFVRVISDAKSTTLIWPEYSGNRLYQTLGNLMLTPRAGLCFPDFETGKVLYLTGTTEVLIGPDAAAILSRTNLAVKFTVTAARLVAKGLPFRGQAGEDSPYNPDVRYLQSERAPKSSTTAPTNTAKLLSQTRLTPTISRFRFALSNTAIYTAGQYVTLDFSRELDEGYSHMRDEDPRSLNDDFIRTFTVSSAPRLPASATKTSDDEFEITIRRVGAVTGFLFKHGLGDDYRRSELEVDIKAFGGEFEVVQKDEEEKVAFVAAGVGITPLLSGLSSETLDVSRLDVLWTVRKVDLGLVADTMERCPKLGASMHLFVTGSTNDQDDEIMHRIQAAGTDVQLRRLHSDDLKGKSAGTWFICTAKPMREQLLQWLPGENVVYEDFDF